MKNQAKSANYATAETLWEDSILIAKNPDLLRGGLASIVEGIALWSDTLSAEGIIRLQAIDSEAAEILTALRDSLSSYLRVKGSIVDILKVIEPNRMTLGDLTIVSINIKSLCGVLVRISQ